MNIQKIEKALDEFAKEFGFGKYDDLNVADLAYLLIRLNGIGRTALHRIEVLQDEKGEQTTPVFVEPGVTVKEVGLGESIRPEGEAVPAFAKDVDSPPPVPPLCAECDGSGVTHLDSRLQPCPKCNGRGRERPCPNCDGSGKVPVFNGPNRLENTFATCLGCEGLGFLQA